MGFEQAIISIFEIWTRHSSWDLNSTWLNYRCISHAHSWSNFLLLLAKYMTPNFAVGTLLKEEITSEIFFLPFTSMHIISKARAFSSKGDCLHYTMHLSIMAGIKIKGSQQHLQGQSSELTQSPLSVYNCNGLHCNLFGPIIRNPKDLCQIRLYFYPCNISSDHKRNRVQIQFFLIIIFYRFLITTDICGIYQWKKFQVINTPQHQLLYCGSERGAKRNTQYL